MKVLKDKVLATLPDECLICSEAFDKSAPDALKTWHIIQEGKYVGIYCPFCWEHSEEAASLYLESKGNFIKS